jgi:hypothetical protein
MGVPERDDKKHLEYIGATTNLSIDSRIEIEKPHPYDAELKFKSQTYLINNTYVLYKVVEPDE